MSFAKFASAVAPLEYRPNPPKPERPKSIGLDRPHPWPIGSIVELTEDFEGFRQGEGFVVSDVVESTIVRGEYFYYNYDYDVGEIEDEAFEGAYANSLILIEEP